MRNKDRLNSIKQGYFKAPTKVFNQGLDVTSLSVYLFMISCSEEFNPSVSFIGKKIGVSRNTVYKSIKILINRNMISVAQRHRTGRVARYQFNKPSDWV